MEEAEKRRKRLSALRKEAAQAQVSYDDAKTSQGSGGLLKPFSETSGAEEELCATPRFDYYTDPMAAFSGDKKGSTPASQSTPNLFLPPSARNPDVTPSPAHQWQNSNPSNQLFQQPQGPTYYSGASRSPGEMPSPYAMHQVNTPGAWNDSGRNSGDCYPSNFHRGVRSPGPGYGAVSSPNINYGQPQYFRGNPGHVGNPGPCSSGSGYRPDGSPSINYGQPQYFSGSPGHVGNPGPCSPCSGYRPVGSPSINCGRNGFQYSNSSSGYGYGRGGSPNPSSGRGQGRWNRNSMSPSPGWSGGASKVNEQYFLTSMLEDPWKDLKPIVWKVKASFNENTVVSSKSRFFEPVSAKKARVFEASDSSGSQQSLAQVLAAAFNEADANKP